MKAGPTTTTFRIACNAGLPLQQFTGISEGDGVVCKFQDVALGDANVCVITNWLWTVQVIVTREWIDVNSQFGATSLASGGDGGVEVDGSDCKGILLLPGEGAERTIVHARLLSVALMLMFWRSRPYVAEH